MHREEKCPDLIPCPWCKDAPVLCSDGLGDNWVECSNKALPSASGHSCPVCPVARADKETLKSGVAWTREQAIEKWNGARGELEEL
jgi:hypothetical protein